MRAISRQLHPSSLRRDEPLAIDALSAIASGLAAVPPAHTEAPARGEVRRTPLLATPAYDAWLVELGDRAVIDAHDHEGSIGVISVTEGHVVEFVLDAAGDRPTGFRRLGPGATTEMGITHRHALAASHGPATTVQVFSPPLGRHDD